MTDVGPLLFVGAHPDDETFCAGGMLNQAVRDGRCVVCVTATHGERGSHDEQRWPTERLADVRTKELEAALEALGVSEHHWLGCQDGACNRCERGECQQRLSELVQAVQPSQIITFGADGLTGHLDHCQVSAWVDEILQTTGCEAPVYHVVLTPEVYESFRAVDAQFNVFWNIDKPPVRPVEQCDLTCALDDEGYRAKLAALRAMPSQTEALLDFCSASQLRQMFGVEAFVSAR